MQLATNATLPQQDTNDASTQVNELYHNMFEVDASGDDDDLSHVYLPNFKQL